ncbi:uncharacterized protein [Watersipora subatra]|uniref:uncharacterized protein n=1 Tax=Watersipora subatra TaxID=2589382 RepID=UPI00355C5FF2
MEETSAIRQSFSMVAHLIGPTKWIQLAKEMQIYADKDFDEEIGKLKKRYRNTPDRIWTCLMDWKLTLGRNAKIEYLICSLHAIDIHWLAGSIHRHLDAAGYALNKSMLEFNLAPSINIDGRGSVDHPFTHPSSTHPSSTHPFSTQPSSICDVDYSAYEDVGLR